MLEAMVLGVASEVEATTKKRLVKNWSPSLGDIWRSLTFAPLRVCVRIFSLAAFSKPIVLCHRILTALNLVGGLAI